MDKFRISTTVASAKLLEKIRNLTLCALHTRKIIYFPKKLVVNSTSLLFSLVGFLSYGA